MRFLNDFIGSFEVRIRGCKKLCGASERLSGEVLRNKDYLLIPLTFEYSKNMHKMSFNALPVLEVM